MLVVGFRKIANHGSSSWAELDELTPSQLNKLKIKSLFWRQAASFWVS